MCCYITRHPTFPLLSFAEIASLLLRMAFYGLIDTELRQFMTEAPELRSVGALSRSFNFLHDSLESLQIVHLGERIESQGAENRN